MTPPSPALVTQRAVQCLPRWALLAFCAAWIVPGVFGRDPWRNEDLSSFAIMSAMAEGRTSWLQPLLGGLPVQPEPLPYWIGALCISLLSPLVEPALAARLPFACLLALTLACTWYACFHLARTESAQPVAFAFGGEADPVDYARAVADGALLALIACLGLLQLGHETTPELMQLFAVSLSLWALAAAPYRVWRARLGVLAGLMALSASGAPSVALILGTAATVICARSTYDPARRLAPWVATGTLAAAGVAWVFGIWGWRLAFDPSATQLLQIARQWAWFLWPAWLLALWTLWRWRRQWLNRHLSLPVTVTLTGMLASIFMGGYDRALMLALPGLAVLAAFALPTMKRSVMAAIDWFSVFFFSAVVIFIWAMYVAMQTGQPARWAANVAKLQPGFQPSFSTVALGFACVGTLAWVALVRWRTGRSRHPLWKSLVLPAGGVALCWLLLMTLWLPLLDYARSARPLIERGLRHVGQASCVAAPGASPAMVAALEVHGRLRVEAGPPSLSDSTRCPVLISFGRISASIPRPGWRLVAAERRNTASSELMSIYRRIEP
jgi:4-amino-4-deoxy-L-arabinose transferase-like glycosyltransferase